MGKTATFIKSVREPGDVSELLNLYHMDPPLQADPPDDVEVPPGYRLEHVGHSYVVISTAAADRKFKHEPDVVAYSSNIDGYLSPWNDYLESTPTTATTDAEFLEMMGYAVKGL